MPVNCFLKIAYDGSCFLGWQKTKTGRSVEEELEKALEKILNKTPTLQAASRTDRGVHALCQVVNFRTDKVPSLMSLHRLLPDDIAALEITTVPDTFHATLSSKSKTYLYELTTAPFQIPQKRFYEWHHPSTLDLSKMKQGAKHLIGVHDFKALTNKKRDPHASTTRHITDISIERLDEVNFRFYITGNNFLYKMVRNIVGLLVKVGEGKIKPEVIADILHSKDRKHPFVSAPAHGLTLFSLTFKPEDK